MPLNIDWQQILLHLLNFLILAVGLGLLIYRPVRDFIRKRAKKYKDKEEAIAKNEIEANKLRSEYESKVSTLNENAKEIIMRADSEAEATINNALKHAEQRSAEILSAAHSAAEAERRELLQSVQHDITDMVVTSAEKLMTLSENEKTDSLLYDRFLGGESADAVAVEQSGRRAELILREADRRAAEIIENAENEAAMRKRKLLSDACDNIADAVSAGAEKLLTACGTLSDGELYDKFLAENIGSDVK